MDRDMASALRGQAVRALVLRIADDGETQVVDVQTHEGVVRGAIEVAQPYGLAAVPLAGALTVVIGLGGDQGDMVALPVANPSDRLGGLAAGEVALYDAAGNRVHIRAGGVIEVRAATRVLVRAPRVEIEAVNGVRITGDLDVTGEIRDRSDAGGRTMSQMRNAYDRHGHPDASAPPSPLMD